MSLPLLANGRHPGAKVHDLDPSSQLAGGLDLWLPLDEGGGDVCADLSPHRRDGAFTGARWTQTEWGIAAEGDGSAGQIDFGADTLISTGSPFTLAVEVRPADFSPNLYPHVVTFKTSSGNPFELTLSDQSGYDGVLIGSDANWARLKSGTASSVLIGSAHLIVVSYNGAGSTTAGNFSAWLDDEPLALAAAGGFSVLQNLNKALKPGTGGSVNIFEGWARNLRKWDRVIEQAERTQLYLEFCAGVPLDHLPWCLDDALSFAAVARLEAAAELRGPASFSAEAAARDVGAADARGAATLALASSVRADSAAEARGAVALAAALQARIEGAAEARGPAGLAQAGAALLEAGAALFGPVALGQAAAARVEGLADSVAAATGQGAVFAEARLDGAGNLIAAGELLLAAAVRIEGPADLRGAPLLFLPAAALLGGAGAVAGQAVMTQLGRARLVALGELRATPGALHRAWIATLRERAAVAVLLLEDAAASATLTEGP